MAGVTLGPVDLGGWLRAVAIGLAFLVASWAVLVVLAARLPPGTARELAGLLPNGVRAARTLARDPRVPRRAKVAVVLAGLWCLSPIDLVPEFLPVIGPLDDAVVLALTLRYAARRVPRDVLVEAWPGDPAVLDRLVGRAGRPGSSSGPTVATVPDKRQDSKQRRAARNRASRDALAARRENAVASRATPSSSSSGPTRAGGSRRAAAPTPYAAAPPPSGVREMLTSRRPGDRAVILSVAFALLALVFVFITKIPVDDRGEPFPAQFGGAAHVAREAVTGEPVPDESKTLISVGGPVVLLFAGIPVAITLFAAFYANRRPDRARWLTYAMFAMAAVVFLTINISVYFLAPLLALGWASFQARKADLPARVAERVVPPERGRRGRRVIDAESHDVTDEDEPVDEPVEEAAAVDEEPDPLAELEAEMEAESEADDSDVGDNGRKPSS
jgi:uncharacterized membrane protein YkvA (DUF1232 family)